MAFFQTQLVPVNQNFYFPFDSHILIDQCFQDYIRHFKSIKDKHCMISLICIIWKNNPHKKPKLIGTEQIGGCNRQGMRLGKNG